MRVQRLSLAVALATAATLAAPALAQDRPTPSGFPVPRYVSLRFDTVNARAGPSDDHRVLWTYHVRGLPVQVIAETADWRRICDPDGGVAWVHRRVTDGRRTAFRAETQPLPLRARPEASAPVSAVLAGRSLIGLDSCRGGWCRLSGGGGSGWAPADAFWGAREGQQCVPPSLRPQPPAR